MRYKDSITYDDNPEGINQYTGGGGSHEKAGGGEKIDSITESKVDSGHSEKVGSLGKGQHVYATPQAKEFASALIKGTKGDNRPGGPTKADKAASEKFWDSHEFSKTGASSTGFGGSRVRTYTNTTTGRSFQVDTKANGEGSSGSDHSIKEV